jgi:pimeloyl-ACP methyl ester carboxylesterase
MPRAHANGIEIEYETFGEPTGEPLLLIMGIALQMIAWPDGLCEALAGRGFRVIRYDNRDSGLSSMMSEQYTLDDMADDAAGLLDALGISSAHVVGASMGGAIAHSLAIRRPEMVRSLVSMMSSTGDPSLMRPDPEVLRLNTLPQPVDRDSAIERAVTVAAVTGSKGMVDEAYIRDLAARSWDRNPSREGVIRQALAVAGWGDHTEALRGLSVPTLVIHGEADPLVSVAAGRATADAIPGARLLLIPGMGHDLPAPVWPQVVDAITAIARDAAEPLVG